MTDRIRQRIDALESQHRDLTMARDQAQRTINETVPMLLQIEGALAVLRDLLVPAEVPIEESKVADGG